MLHLDTTTPHHTHTVCQEPICSLIFNPSAVRDGHPCCHAYWSSKDGCDLIVGIANGEGEQSEQLMREQLQEHLREQQHVQSQSQRNTGAQSASHKAVGACWSAGCIHRLRLCWH